MNMDRFKYRAYFNFAEECTGLKDSTKWEELTPAEQKEWCRSHASAEWEGKVRASQQKKVWRFPGRVKRKEKAR